MGEKKVGKIFTNRGNVAMAQIRLLHANRPKTHFSLDNGLIVTPFVPYFWPNENGEKVAIQS